MELIDILKAGAGLSVDDPLAVLFAERCMADTSPKHTVYRTSDNKVFFDISGKTYALMEETYGS